MITRVLVIGVVTSCGAVVAFGKPELHILGPTAIFLGFGLVPPLFLPLFAMLRYTGWMRVNVDRNRRARRNMRWIS